MSLNLKCIKCNKIFPFDIGLTTCPDHDNRYGYLEVINNPLNFHSNLTNNNCLDLGQTKTPLIKADNFAKLIGVPNFYIKNEGENPTGSFKDRENFIFFNFLIKNKIKKTIYVISSGNAALSTAAYANKSGYECICYIPKKTSEQKKDLIKYYGGKLIELNGSYEEIYNKIIKNPPTGINATPGICPLKEEGDKLIAYEIFEELGIPDKIIVPCGNGTLLWSIYKGFKEIKEAGKTKKMPKMIGVQIKGGDPIAKAIKESKDYVSLINAPNSVAEGIIATESYSSAKVVKAINETDGKMISVSDGELISAHNQVIKLESITPELTSSSVYAAVKKLKINSDETIVCINTGNQTKKKLAN